MGGRKKVEMSPQALAELRAIGARIRDARKAQALSQTAVAAATAEGPWEELNQDSWSRLERGDMLPTVLQLHAAADALGLPLADIAFGPPAGVSEPGLLIDRLIAANRFPAAMKALAAEMEKAAREQA